jgi:hypothetical protein
MMFAYFSLTSGVNPVRCVYALIFCICLLCPTNAKEKERKWQTGTFLDTNRERTYAGTVDNASGTATTSGDTTYGNASGGSTAAYRVYEMYKIDAGDYIYECQEDIRWRWSKPAMLTVNGPVHFAIEKDRLYIKSEDGSEHETKIIKKILKPKAPAS